MTVKVRFFARAKDLAGADTILVDVGAGATVAELRQNLVQDLPQLRNLLERSAVAIDDEFVGDDYVIADGAEVAILPPVSGGGCC